jgi:spore coat protein CotH
MKRILIIFTSIVLVTTLSAQSLFEMDNIATIEIYFPQENWNQLMIDNYETEEYLIADSVIFNGSMKDSVGVKYKGNSTFSESNAKNPLNISIDYIKSNQDYQGHETIKLSSGQKDPSFLREALSYEIARKYMEAPRSNYAKVYINGSYHGLYTNSESVNSDFQNNYLYSDKNNTRIKCNPQNVTNGGSSLEYLGADSSSYYDFYEMKSDASWQDLIDLTNTIENSANTIENSMDIDRAIWMSAFNNVLVNLDSYSGPFRQNYYLIKDDNNRMNTIIWDLNECLGGFKMVNQGPGGGGQTDLTQLDPMLREGDSDWPLLNLIFSNSTYRKMYVAHMRTILNENFTNDWYAERGLELQNLIKADVQADPNTPYNYDDFIANLNNDVDVGGGGPGGGNVNGIINLLNARSEFLSTHDELTKTPPTISTISTTPSVVPSYSTANLIVNVEDASYVYLAYRFRPQDRFVKVQMLDDGNHNDGAANDGTYGVSVDVDALDMQYYIYAENSEAGIFSPERAEHEYHNLPIVGSLVINEFMASNVSSVQDTSSGFVQYDDWVELYNGGDITINLGGYHLSDNENVLDKWTFPDVEIQANDYLIVWLDKDDAASSGIHTSFQLAADGEELFLSTANNFIIDALFYNSLPSDLGYARVPNGKGPFVVQTHTFNANNGLGTSIVENVNSQLHLYPNPTSDNLTIQIPYAQRLKAYDLLGKEHLNLSHIRGSANVNVSTWPKGIYIFIIDNESRKITIQ